MPLKKFIIEREIAGIGASAESELSDAAKTSNAALAQLSPRVQWSHSYVCGDKTFCVYFAEDEDAIREHSRLSGFPSTIITEVQTVIDPATAG